MAEAIGQILGEYTIPSQYPIIYITDSNNARTLQKNIKTMEEFTHRKWVRQVKQGIDYSIANHLEYLTKRWPREDQLSAQMQRILLNGREVCLRWARQCNITNLHQIGIQNTPLQQDPNTTSDHTTHTDNDSDDWSSSSDDTNSTIEEQLHDAMDYHSTNRYHFNESMINILDQILIIKVYSHQLNKDFSIKQPGKHPSPNLFVVSTNRFADNAASQVRAIVRNLPHTFDHTYYPPFSPRWCFTFEGKVTNKGATRLLYTKMDDELCLRLKHREKQGLLCRLLQFNGIKAEFIGNESMARNIIKGTAPCPTRAIHHHPSVANLIWRQWYNTLSMSAKATTSINLPHGWQKIPSIADNIIKQCPFCNGI
jgi:hypothetical protein